MESNKILDILDMNDEADSSELFYNFVREDGIKGSYFIDSILEQSSDIKIKYKRSYRLAWIIFGELQSHHFGWGVHFHIDNKNIQLQKFLYEWDIFLRKKVNWDDWLDIAEEGLTLIEEFIDSDVDNYNELSSYKDFMTKINLRIKDLIDNGKYDHEFQEWGKDD